MKRVILLLVSMMVSGVALAQGNLMDDEWKKAMANKGAVGTALSTKVGSESKKDGIPDIFADPATPPAPSGVAPARPTTQTASSSGGIPSPAASAGIPSPAASAGIPSPAAGIGLSSPTSTAAKPALPELPSAPKRPGPSATDLSGTFSGSPSDQLIGTLSSDTFQKMAEYERDNAMLELQLKREKLNSDIATIKNAQRQSILQEIDRREAAVKARRDIQMEQRKRAVDEEERLEKAKQRTMQIEAMIKREAEERAERRRQEELKRKEEERLRAEREKREAEERAQREAEVAAAKAAAAARAAEDQKGPPPAPVSSTYVVREIRGVGDNMIAKLATTDGSYSFYVREGSRLLGGHTVSKIDKDYVIASLDGADEMIGFYSGGLSNVVDSSSGNMSSSGRTGSSRTGGASRGGSSVVRDRDY